MKRYKILLKAFRELTDYATHQIESFNEFVNMRLQKIIDSLGEIELESPGISSFKLRFGKVKVLEPQIKEADGATRKILPTEARIRELTYSAPILVEILPVINDVEQEPQWIKIGELPIMVKSCLCPLSKMTPSEQIAAGEDPNDPGGYFIINGTERVVVMIEEMISNRPVIEMRGGIATVRINSCANGFVQKHILEHKDIITISFANLKKLPVIILLKALGAKSDKDIVDMIATNEREAQELYFQIYEYGMTTEEAKKEIAKRLGVTQKEYIEPKVSEILDRYLLPHLGQTRNKREDKIEYLCLAIRKLIKLNLGEIESQDIDHCANKRLTMVADLLEVLIRSVLASKYGLINRIVYSYQKLIKRGKLPTLSSIVEGDYLTKRIISHMATGQWVGGRTGVCQRLERTNYIRAIEHLRNIVSPLSSSQEHFEARALHPTTWGRLCCEKTPEGVNIGLRKYLATMIKISRNLTNEEKNELLKVVKKYNDNGNWYVFVDGNIVAKTSKPKQLEKSIKSMRRKGELSHHINVAYNEDVNEFYINTDSGRLQRPLIIVENGKSKLTTDILKKLEKGEMKWIDLLENGIIEYLDAEEEENAQIALRDENIDKETTHLEINPNVILGISAALVPFPEHNRGDRVNYGAKMCGQALGLYLKNFLLRTDTKADVLIYPQKPIVSTAVSKFFNIENTGFGQNVIVAIMCYKGYNMDDALVIKKSAIERGLGRSYILRTYTIEERKYWGIEKDEICIPDKTVAGYKTEEAYANLDENGIINREIEVESGDVLVGRVSPLRFYGPSEGFMMETENRRETSETVRQGEDGIVDNVIITETESGNKLIKVVVRTHHMPEVGDKFASRHGQKGIIGLVVAEEDMPFTKDGITPDIILNPHAIPSRMTVGQLLEILFGKVNALACKNLLGTAFDKSISEKEIRKILKELGFEEDGKEVMYDGVTGKQFEAKIFIGPCFYQKLHHLVINKIHSRARGPIALLTKQPTAGRAKQGGLRLGEMEKDCLIAHGASLLLKERFDSDKTIVPVCKYCGLIAIHDRIKNIKYCPVCKKSDVIDIPMSYAFKLMLDELKAMCIYPKIVVEE